MAVFSVLFSKLIVLYVLIFLGFLAARFLSAQRETIAKLLIYMITPVIVFYGTYSADINLANLSLPIVLFLLCTFVSLSFLAIGKLAFKTDATKNILAFAAGTGNTGYFGLPVALFLFGDQIFSVAVLTLLGFVLFENSVGFYLVAKGHNSSRQSLLKLVKLPSIYAFFLGLVFNYFSLDLDALKVLEESFKGSYTLLGMMMIGMGLSKFSTAHTDLKFIALSFTAKFFAWPLIVVALIAIDKSFFGFYNKDIYNIFTLMSIVPLAANSVAYAVELKVYPDKVALTVLLSTIFALFYIPFILGFLV